MLCYDSKHKCACFVALVTQTEMMRPYMFALFTKPVRVGSARARVSCAALAFKARNEHV